MGVCRKCESYMANRWQVECRRTSVPPRTSNSEPRWIDSQKTSQFLIKRSHEFLNLLTKFWFQWYRRASRSCRIPFVLVHEGHRWRNIMLGIVGSTRNFRHIDEGGVRSDKEHGISHNGGRLMKQVVTPINAYLRRWEVGCQQTTQMDNVSPFIETTLGRTIYGILPCVPILGNGILVVTALLLLLLAGRLLQLWLLWLLPSFQCLVRSQGLAKLLNFHVHHAIQIGLRRQVSHALSHKHLTVTSFDRIAKQ